GTPAIPKPLLSSKRMRLFPPMSHWFRYGSSLRRYSFTKPGNGDGGGGGAYCACTPQAAKRTELTDTLVMVDFIVVCLGGVKDRFGGVCSRSRLKRHVGMFFQKLNEMRAQLVVIRILQECFPVARPDKWNFERVSDTRGRAVGHHHDPVR